MTVEGVAGAAGIQGIGNSGEMTLATMFAMLQLEMASEKKAQAEEVISSIKAENEVLRQARAFLQEARKAQADAKAGNGNTEYRKDDGTLICTKAEYDAAQRDSFTKFVKNPYDISGSPGGSKDHVYESPEMTEFRKKYNIEFDTKGDDTYHNKDEWELNIKNLETFIESRGMDTQTKMVQLEDLMGKYNAWTQGASKTISDGNQLLQAIATR
jgi:hypothetical protein